MGVIIPQVVTSDRASGAQVIDGSLKFDGTSNYLIRTPGSAGNRRTFTISFWVKRNFNLSDKIFQQRANSDDSQQFGFQFRTDDTFRVLDQESGSNILVKDTTRVFRDLGWYHIVVAVDTTDGTAEDRMKLYVNGVRETSFSTNTNYSTQNYQTSANTTDRILLGANRPNSSSSLNSFVAGSITQYYLIDGQALGPESFGFTDGLTNTWRPKKYSTSIPTNNPNNGTARIIELALLSGLPPVIATCPPSVVFRIGSAAVVLSNATEESKFTGVQLFPLPDLSSPIGEFPSIGR